MIGRPGLAGPRWLRPATAGLVGGLVLLASLLDARPGSGGHAPWELRLGAVAVVGVVWLLELVGVRLPRPVFALAIAIPVGWLNVTRDGAISILFLALAVAWVAQTGSHRQSLVTLAVTLAATLSYLLNVDPEGWLSFSAGLVLTWVAVRGLVSQQRLLAELRAAQADLAREAQAAERRRIAREIHDVAAHSLTVTMLQLTGARLLLQRVGGDPRAIEAIGEAERLRRQSLDDVRRTVGLLADTAPEDATTPLPGGADLETLVAQYRRAGLDVTLAIRGDLGRLPAATGLALYRIVQEALANVVKHAPGARAWVDLSIDGAARLRVRNSGGRAGVPPIRSGGGSGLGLAGMRERTRLLGGTLEAAPEGDGWLVECSLPLAADAPPVDPSVQHLLPLEPHSG